MEVDVVVGNESADALDIRLVRARFVEAVSHWRLADAETEALLGVTLPVGGDLCHLDLGEDAEARMRLAIDVAHGLDRIFAEEVLLEWLRDDEDDMLTPLAFMSRGVTELRAMRAAAAARAS